jgi:site-specific recombinase XerD
LESDIKSGIDFSFPWMNDYGNVKVVHYSLDQAIDDYLQVRKLEGLREGTIEIYENALKGLVSTVGKNIPVNHITFQNIESMKKRLRSNLSSATLNMKLRAIKTFFNRLNENEQIDQNLKIKLVKTKKVYLPILLMKNGVKSKTLIYH